MGCWNTTATMKMLMRMKKMNLHWINNEQHICKWCGQNLLSPHTTSECPKTRLLKTPEETIQEISRELDRGNIKGAKENLNKGWQIASKTYGYSKLNDAIKQRSSRTIADLEYALQIVEDFSNYKGQEGK